MKNGSKYPIPEDIIIYRASSHKVVFLFPLLFSVCIILLLIGRSLVTNFIYSFVILTTWLSGFIYYKRMVLILTNDEILASGALGHPGYRFINIPLNKIRLIQVHQNWLGKRLNYGAIVIRRAGPVYKFPNVDNPLEFKRKAEVLLASIKSYTNES